MRRPYPVCLPVHAMTTPGEALTCHRCGAQCAPEHRFCGSCGAEVRAGDIPEAPAEPPARPQPAMRASEEMDRLAGAPYDPSPHTGAVPAEQLDNALPYYIPPNRIALLTVLSAGLYIFYWMYITWRHYRDHTGETAYPIFHALSLMVPVYQLFRLHAHMRVFQEMMESRGVPSTLSPLRAVLIYFGVILLGMVSIMIPSEAPLTLSQQAAYVVIIVSQSALLAWMLWRAQTNFNRLWQHRLGMRLGWMPLNPAEVAVAILGFIFGWGMLAVILIDPTLLPADPAASP